MWLTVSTNCCQHRGSQAGSPRIVRWSGNRSSESIVTLWDMQRQEEDEEEGRDSTMYSSTRCRFFHSSTSTFASFVVVVCFGC